MKFESETYRVSARAERHSTRPKLTPYRDDRFTLLVQVIRTIKDASFVEKVEPVVLDNPLNSIRAYTSEIIPDATVSRR